MLKTMAVLNNWLAKFLKVQQLGLSQFQLTTGHKSPCVTLYNWVMVEKSHEPQL